MSTEIQEQNPATVNRRTPDLGFEKADKVNITARTAKRIVNIELLKVGNLIMSGCPKLQRREDDKLYWEVPFLVVPPDEDLKTYPTGRSAFVDAESGLYGLKKENIQELRAAAEPILDKLYPDLEEYMEKIREIQSRL